MSSADIDRINEKQRRMTVVDKELRELETLEYYLNRDPSVYGDDLELAQERYLELKEYYGVTDNEQMQA